MNKKIITSLIAAAMLVSSSAAFAAESDIMLIGENDASTEIVVSNDMVIPESEVKSSKYTKIDAEAVKVEKEALTIKSEDKESSVAISEDTVVLNYDGTVKQVADIKAGDKLHVYSADDAVAVIVISSDDEEKLNVDVDTYVKSDSFGAIVNSANSLALHLNEEADITDLDGNKVEYTELENKNLAVFYEIVALSMPGQTTPVKIVVLGEEAVQETPSKPEVVAPEYTKVTAEAVEAGDGSLTVKADQQADVNVAEAPVVFAADGELKQLSDIKAGDKLCLFTKDGSASVIVIIDEESEVSVDISKYAKSEEMLVNAENTLALNLGEETLITDVKGEKAEAADLDGKTLAVFYTASTRSIPAQTTPVKVVVLDEEAEEVADPAAVTKVTANGKEICEVKYDSDSKTFMVPVRAIAEELGYTVGWEGGELRVTVGNDAANVDFKIGENAYTLAGSEATALEKAAELINDTTFVPVSLFDKVLGNKVAINGDILEVTAE